MFLWDFDLVLTQLVRVDVGRSLHVVVVVRNPRSRSGCTGLLSFFKVEVTTGCLTFDNAMKWVALEMFVNHGKYDGVTLRGCHSSHKINRNVGPWLCWSGKRL